MYTFANPRALGTRTLVDAACVTARIGWIEPKPTFTLKQFQNCRKKNTQPSDGSPVQTQGPSLPAGIQTLPPGGSGLPIGKEMDTPCPYLTRSTNRDDWWCSLPRVWSLQVTCWDFMSASSKILTSTQAFRSWSTALRSPRLTSARKACEPGRKGVLSQPTRVARSCPPARSDLGSRACIRLSAACAETNISASFEIGPMP